MLVGSLALGICGLPSPCTTPPCCSALWAPVIWPRHIKSDGVALEVRVKGMIAQVGSHLPCWFRGKACRGDDGFWRSTPINVSLHSRCHGQEFGFYPYRTHFVD